jgi:DNA replication protein DnaC
LEKRITHYLKPNLLILDNFTIKEITETKAEDLYRIIDRLYNSSFTKLIANRVPKD